MAASRLLHRPRQLLRALAPSEPVTCRTIVDAFLPPAGVAAFAEMPARDRAHACRVALALPPGAPRDLVAAALLHDVGKSDGRARAGIPSRIARVVLTRLAPGILRALALPPPSGRRAGLVLAVHHPALGAVRAREVGCSPRTVWLIAHHEDGAAAAIDADLAMLRTADDAAS